MKTMKYLKISILPAILLAVLVTGFSMKKNESPEDNSEAELVQLEGVSEFYYKPEGDSRVWHVLNTYTSGFSEDTSEYNNSVYIFTKDSVTVINKYTGINSLNIIQ